jgi:3-hydroxyacyl-[acyl-carrier-protein] dehydratase
MKFALTDRVVELDAGRRIAAVKNVALAEEYLQDHFPVFPVLPGVFMVQAMVEAATWLVRVTEDFKHSLITLAEARNVKYQSFVKPGDQMTVEVTAEEIGPDASKFKGQARVGERVVVQARLALRHENLADSQPKLADLDRQMLDRFRRHWEMIKPGAIGIQQSAVSG